MALAMEQGGESQPTKQPSGDWQSEIETDDSQRQFFEWLDGKDHDIAFGLVILEQEQPDLFAAPEAKWQYLADLANLTGKREILQELIEKFGYKRD